MNNNEILYHLIANSLQHKKYTFESPEELELTKIIFENGLVGLTFNSIDKTSFKLQKYYQMLEQAFGSFVSKDVQQQAIISQIKAILNKAEIKHIFLKGSHLKSLYPESYMRGMGDMDVIVPLDVFEKAKSLFVKNGFIFKSATSHHHVYETIDGNYIELHQSITSSNEYENEAFLKDIWAHTFKLDQYTHGLEYAFEYVYLLTHLIRHIRTSGVGIRSLLDMYVFDKAYSVKIDHKLLNTYLERFHLKDFNDKVVHLNKIFTNQIKPNDKDLAVIDYITASGIHGTGGSHDPYVTKRTHEQTRLKKSKFRYVLGEVFPSRARIQESYPYLKKHPWLLPWAWFVRGFKQVFKFKNTKKRLKSVSSDDKLDEVKDVYDYLGI